VEEDEASLELTLVDNNEGSIASRSSKVRYRSRSYKKYHLNYINRDKDNIEIDAYFVAIS
jgi:hypothetical protein